MSASVRGCAAPRGAQSSNLACPHPRGHLLASCPSSKGPSQQLTPGFQLEGLTLLKTTWQKGHSNPIWTFFHALCREQ